MTWIKLPLAFTLGLGVGLVARHPPAERSLTAQVLARQSVQTADSRREFRARPSYYTARRLALHLSAQRGMEESALGDGLTIANPIPQAEALEAALQALALAETATEREEAERLLVRAEQLGL